MNTKYQKSNEIALSSLYSIITDDNNIALKCKSICTDFGDGLYNANSKIFKDLRRVGCYFHSAKNI